MLLKVNSQFVGLMKKGFVLFIGVAYIRIIDSPVTRLIWAPYIPSLNQFTSLRYPIIPPNRDVTNRIPANLARLKI